MAYRARRSQSTRRLAPHGAHCWGGDGSLLFPRWLCQRSHALYAAGFFRAASPSSSPLPWPSSVDPGLGSQLAPFGEVSYDAAGFASCCGPLACTLPRRGLDPALRRPGLPERRRATTKVTWFLLWPDSHRLVIVSFQDARSTVHPVGGPAIRQAGVFYRVSPGPCKPRPTSLDIWGQRDRAQMSLPPPGLRAKPLETRCTQFDPEPAFRDGTEETLLTVDR